MAPPIPKNKWSWKHDECITCGTRKKSGRDQHYIKGQCQRCYDHQRNREPERKVKSKQRRDKWKQKVKSDPELFAKFKQYHKDWRTNSTSFKIFFRKQKKKLRYERFIKSWFENKNKKWQKRHQGIVTTFEINDIEYKIRTPLLKIKDHETDLVLFEKLLKKYINEHSEKQHPEGETTGELYSGSVEDNRPRYKSL